MIKNIKPDMSSNHKNQCYQELVPFLHIPIFNNPIYEILVKGKTIKYNGGIK